MNKTPEITRKALFDIFTNPDRIYIYVSRDVLSISMIEKGDLRRIVYRNNPLDNIMQRITAVEKILKDALEAFEGHEISTDKLYLDAALNKRILDQLVKRQEFLPGQLFN